MHELIDSLQNYGIHTAESLMSELERMEEEAAAIRNRLAQIDRRLRDIPEIIRSADTVKCLQPIKVKRAMASRRRRNPMPQRMPTSWPNTTKPTAR